MLLSSVQCCTTWGWVCIDFSFVLKLVAPYHSPGSSIQKSVHFLPFIKWFGFFSFHLEAAESQFLFSVKFWDLPLPFGKFPRFYFGIFLKLSIVSRVFNFLIKSNWCYAFKGVNLCWKKSQVSLEGFEPCQAPPVWGQECSLWKMYGSKEGAYIFRGWLLQQYMQSWN